MERVFIHDNSTDITYYFSGVKSIAPNKSSTYTSYPIPEGGNISDHVYNSPNSLSISLISDGYNMVKKSYYVTKSGETINLSYEAFRDLINNWMKNATQLDVQTVHDLFKSMCINSISWDESSNNWSRFNPTISLKEIRIAQIYTTSLKALDVSTSASYSRENDQKNSTGNTSGTASISTRVLGGAAAGATVGLLFGPKGALIGGVIGAAVEGFKAFLRQ